MNPGIPNRPSHPGLIPGDNSARSTRSQPNRPAATRGKARTLGFMALLAVALSHSPQAAFGQASDNPNVALQALERLKGIDLESNPSVKTAVLRVLQQVRGKPAFVDIVRDFEIQGQEPALVDFAATHPKEGNGVEAVRLVLKTGDLAPLRSGLAHTNTARVAGLAEALSQTGDKQVLPLLQEIVASKRLPEPALASIVRATQQTEEGARAVLQWTGTDLLPPAVRQTAVAELARTRWPDIAAEAAKRSAESTPSAPQHPPIPELLSRKGDPARGAAVFRRDAVGCIRCHQVRGEGIDFGPSLTEIGTKLGKDALYASILEPSAGISFGFEAWSIELKEGEEHFGLIVSESTDEIALKQQSGVVTRLRKGSITRRTQQKLSIMPAGLEQTLTTQELVDLVEYLSSLRKP